ncbi:PREDICTED: piggyBac transposable element-derived protein 4-like [Dufourea novaeangliae]|uniref:piggyBac transposable element-derived protein 4-like n=1 Tax=Dufourea novaeangliae TaxID=178035 RepID=UPI0007672993|nr:PREDICTED: piggyBac transposable element-derived protein 4-like [Dufourea novaeangliae]
MFSRRVRNRIISDSENSDDQRETHVNSIYNTLSDDELPLSKRLDELQKERQWKIATVKENFVPKIMKYTDNCSGVQSQSNITENTSPTSIFKFFFNEDLVREIVENTNKYRRAKGQCRQRSSNKITFDDIYSFLAISIYMGIVQLPKTSMYWSTDPLYNFPLVRQAMNRKKFLEVQKYLHLSDIDNEDNNDKACKIRPVIDMLVQRFQKAYRPGQYVVVDESLMLWKGRLSFKQFIPSKRARFGLKSFVLCDSETSYAYNMKLYTGRMLEEWNDQSIGVSGSVVMDLSKNILNQGRTMFLDNWYSSPALYEKLHKNGTNVCGTVRLKRKAMPCDEQVKNAKKTKKRRYDKRVVSTLTTAHTPRLEESIKIDRTTGDCIKKPNTVIDYNQYMGGVDRMDQILQGCSSLRKSIK